MFFRWGLACGKRKEHLFSGSTPGHVLVRIVRIKEHKKPVARDGFEPSIYGL
jgi:hypothetical protein